MRKCSQFAAYISIILWVGVIVSESAQAASSTTYIRELAKNNSPVFIITTTPEGAEIGKSLEGAIARHPDNKHKPGEIALLKIQEAAYQAEMNAKFKEASLIFLIIRKEQTGQLPPSLSSLMPLQMDGLSKYNSAIRSEKARHARKGLAFYVAMIAPDADRLRKLADIFEKRSSPHFDSLPFASEYLTNKIAVFSASEDGSIVEQWGTERNEREGIWNEINWRSLQEREKIGAEQLEECHEVYFIDRSRQDNNTIPSPAKDMLAKHKFMDTTILVERNDKEEGFATVVFSAPNQILLHAMAGRYPDLTVVPKATTIKEVCDLRNIKTTTLLVQGNGVSAEEAGRIRTLMAKEMREKLHIKIEERGSVLKLLSGEVTLQQIQGATDTANKLRREIGIRYVWIFDIVNYGGQTQYDSRENKLTSDLGVFPKGAPSKPARKRGIFGTGHNKPIEQYEKEVREWELAYRRWERERDAYEQERQYSMPCQWERSVNRVSIARVGGILKLFDLEKPGEVVWEKECRAEARDGGVYQSDSVTLQGHINRPNSLTPPPTEDRCPQELLLKASEEAWTIGINTLSAEALLPSSDEANGKDEKPVAPPVAPASTGPQVAAIDGDMVTITVGSSQGIQIGCLVKVRLPDREIKNEAGEVIDTRSNYMNLRVKTVQKTSDCVPVSSQDAAKLSQLKAGMPVTWQRLPARKPAKPARKVKGKAKLGK